MPMPAVELVRRVQAVKRLVLRWVAAVALMRVWPAKEPMDLAAAVRQVADGERVVRVAAVAW